jgi:hypothetical protein
MSKKRLAWCKLNRHKTVNDFWKNVIYSDECKIELEMDNRAHIWWRMDSTMLESRSWCSCKFDVLGLHRPIWGVGTLSVVGIYISRYNNIIEKNDSSKRVWGKSPVVLNECLYCSLIFWVWFFASLQAINI